MIIVVTLDPTTSIAVSSLSQRGRGKERSDDHGAGQYEPEQYRSRDSSWVR